MLPVMAHVDARPDAAEGDRWLTRWSLARQSRRALMNLVASFAARSPAR